MEHGIMHNLKQNYRKRLVHRIIRAFENDGKVPKVTLLYCVRQTTEAWDDAGSTTITNCFRKEGSRSDDEDNEIYFNNDERFDCKNDLLLSTL
jgi:hypothetical protein